MDNYLRQRYILRTNCPDRTTISLTDRLKSSFSLWKMFLFVKGIRASTQSNLFLVFFLLKFLPTLVI